MFLYDADLVPFNGLPNLNLFSRNMSGIKMEVKALLLGQFSKFTGVYQDLVRPHLSSFFCPL